MEIAFDIWILPLLLLIVVWYFLRPLNYWSKHGIPHEPSLPFLGSLGSFLPGDTHARDLRRCKKYGRIFGHYEGNSPVLNIAEPEILKNVMVKDFQYFQDRRDVVAGNPIIDKMVISLTGDDWKRVRTILTPSFTTGKIKKMMDIILNSTRTLSGQFAEASKTGKPLDMKESIGCFVIDVIACTAFGTKIDSHNDPNNQFVRAAKDAFASGSSWRFYTFFLLPKISKWFGISFLPPDALQFFKDATLQIVKERRRTKQVHNDFLQLLMDASSESSEAANGSASEKIDKEILQDIGHEEGNEKIFQSTISNKSMSSDELVAQCVIFFLAGYDTTATTLSLALYSLALNPEVQERLFNEVDTAAKDKKGEIVYDIIQSMKYLDKVISETLRMYAIAVRTERQTTKDYNLEAYNFTIPKDMIVGIPVYAMHWDPEFFPNPEKFDPDRFDAEEKSLRHPYAYLPFGAGPRNCIGMRFAMMEMKICLAYLVLKYSFSKCPETKIPLKFHSGQNLLHPNEIKLKVEARK